MSCDPIAEYSKIGIFLRRAGSLFSGLCPFHEETVGSFFVYPDLSYYCQGCKKGGPFKKLLKDLEISGVPDLNFERLSLPEAFSNTDVISFYFFEFMILIKDLAPMEKKKFILNYERLRMAVDYLTFENTGAEDLMRFFFAHYSKLKQGVEECQKSKNSRS